MFVLSYVLPPEGGAKYGKATVQDFQHPANAAAAVRDVLIEHGVKRAEAVKFGLMLAQEGYSTNWEYTGTGLVFRIDPEDRAPNACPCCGRLVQFGDHAFAGSDDAYCLGCYTWGDDAKIGCDPNHSAHANPWSTNAQGAQWFMEVIIDRGDETDSDYRYAADASHEMWDDEDNALIAWPGLTREQIISVEIKEIQRNEMGECKNGSPTCTPDDPCVICHDEEK
jgi:hypothetical protein